MADDATTPEPEADDTFDVDAVIAQLVNAKGKSADKFLKETDVYTLIDRVRPVFLEQPTLLELNAPIKIVGDVHGQFSDLLRLFSFGGHPPAANYLFLGDYVDRGKQSLETICLLFAYKIKYPENFFMLRGNHEVSAISRIYGFYDECKRRYNAKMWKTFCGVFVRTPQATNCLTTSEPVYLGGTSDTNRWCRGTCRCRTACLLLL